jgi:dephospho-CoA kinase
MLKVALTGGIATGKSYVLARLRGRGIPTIDADDVVHEALGPDTPTTRAIATEFGNAFLRADGSVNRAALADCVFASPDMRLRLEAIVHPVVYAAIHAWFDSLQRPAGVASIPLLYETGHERDFDLVVATVCRPEIQMSRLIQRDGLTSEAAQQRLDAQMPAAEKALRGNFVIETGGTMAETDRQVEELILKYELE